MERETASEGEQSAAHAPPPQSLGRYRFVASLGHGGMAEVFLAVAQGPAGFNKLVVIKRVKQNLAEDPALAAMFLDEARLAARLNHRNVVQTNEVDISGGQYFMAMEYLDGQPLHRVLGRARELDKPLPLPVISRILCDALSGLHYAHDLSDYDGTPLHIVHRDVSPQNVFVTYDGQVKIVDFGIAKAARRAVETETGVIKGKVSYMAPEQAFAASSEVDRRADVFSVGVLLWEILAGRRLWQDMGDPEIIAALLDDVPGIRSVKPEVDPEVARLCDRALARSPDARFPSAADFRVALERAAPPASAEEVGAFVAALFADQRAEIKALIAGQVDLAVQGESVDLIDLDRGSPLRNSSRRKKPSSRPPPSRSVEGETPPAATSALFAQASLPRSRTRLVVSALFVAGVGVTGYAVIREPAPLPSHSPASSATAPAAAASPGATAIVAPSTTPAGAYIHVRIGGSPPEAKLLLDGAALPSNPFEGKFMKDGAVHRVQAESPGFTGQSRIVVFDKDQGVDVALQPKPKLAEAPSMKPDPY